MNFRQPFSGYKSVVTFSASRNLHPPLFPPSLRVSSSFCGENSPMNSAWVQSKSTSKFRVRDHIKLAFKPDNVAPLRFVPPATRLAWKSDEECLAYKCLLYMRRRENPDSLLYYKWGLWIQHASSATLEEVLETRLQIKAVFKELKNKRGNTVLHLMRLGIEPGSSLVRENQSIVFRGEPFNAGGVMYEVARIVLGDRLYVPGKVCSMLEICLEGLFCLSTLTSVPVIGITLDGLPSTYFTLTLWLGAGAEMCPPEKILSLIECVHACLPIEYEGLIDSAVLVDPKAGTTTMLFDSETERAPEIASA